MKRMIALICIAALLLCTTACGSGSTSASSGQASAGSDAAGAAEASVSTAEAGSAVPEVTASVTEDTKYHAAIVSMSPEDFEAAGFTLGDSCDISFSSGYTLSDVPFYNGYYVKNGEPVVVAYPGFETITVTLNNMGIWDSAGLAEGDTVTIRLNEAGEYSDIQDSLGQVYSFDRADYADDAEFCNFRALTGGSLKKDFFYRGASPVDNSRGRASYTDSLLQANGIHFILDLADSQEDMDGYLASEDFASPYAFSLYEAGNVALLDMGSAYESDDYCQKLVTGLRQMMESEGPVYIHCMEGKDRTGFVCMLLEAFAGATYDEMLADYMITYSNYYQVTPEGTPEKYDAIAELYFDSFVIYLHGTEDQAVLSAADYTEDAADYLRSGGMTDAELELLRAYISE